MHSKIVLLIAVLILMATTVLPLQGLGQVTEPLERSFSIWAVVPVGLDETTQVFVVSKSPPGQQSDSSGVTPVLDIIMIIDNQDPGSNCRQSATIPVEPSYWGIHIMEFSKGLGSLSVNGGDLILDACFNEQNSPTQRVSIAMGVSLPPKRAEKIAANPTAVQPLGVQDVWVTYTTIGPNGATRAASVDYLIVGDLNAYTNEDPL